MEELEQILTNDNMTSEQKKEAINKYIGSNYMPTSKYTDKMNEAKTKYEALESDFTAFKNAKMTEEEKKAEAEALQAQKFKEQSNSLSKYIIKDVFTSNGLEVDEEKMVNLIQATPDLTKVIAESVASMLKTQKESLNASFKETLKTQTNKPANGNVDDPNKAQTDLEALQAKYSNATTAVERVEILSQINALNNK